MEKDFQREYLGSIQETKSLKDHLKMLLPLFFFCFPIFL